MSIEAADREAGGPDGENVHGTFRSDLYSLTEYAIIYGTGLFLLLCPAELLRGLRVGVSSPQSPIL